MKKDCTNCLYGSYNEEEIDMWCNRYDCKCKEVAREENPSCWEDLPADYYDAHTCEYNANGMCEICGAIRYGSSLYRELYGGE